MRATGEILARTCPDFSQDRRRGYRSDSGDRHQQVPVAGKRDHHVLHLRATKLIYALDLHTGPADRQTISFSLKLVALGPGVRSSALSGGVDP